MKRILRILVASAAALVPEARFLRAGGLGQGQQVAYRQRLSNFKNVQYFGSLTIGGQELAGIFDTGSFDLLVRSTRCDWCLHPTSPYDRTKSGTYLKNGTLAKHKFGSGPCESMKGYEEVVVGPLRAKPQAFYEIVSHEMPILHHAHFAAIVGIGPNLAYGNTDPTLLMSFNVSEFSVCLQRASGADGYMTWGATVDHTYKEAHYVKASVVGNYHWATRLRSVGTSASSWPEDAACGGEGCVAIIDSGTSLIAAPLAALEQLSRQIQPVKEDCSNLHELPTLRFQVDGKTLVLPPRAYVMRITGKVVDFGRIWDLLFFRPKMKKVNICVAAFMQLDMMSKLGPVWILGMPFLRYYHTTFDRERKAMYFAKAGPDCFPQPIVANSTADLGQFLQAPFGDEADGPLDVDAGAMMPPPTPSVGVLLEL